MNVTSLSSMTANMGAITAGTITLDASGYIRGGQTAYRTGNGFWEGYDTSTYKFSIKGSSGDEMYFDGSTLKLNNVSVNDIVNRSQAQFTKTVFLGRNNDGLTETTTGVGYILRYLMMTHMGSNAGAGTAKLESIVMGGTSASMIDFSSDMEFLINAKVANFNNNSVVFFGIFEDGSDADTTDYTNPVETTRHIGFYFADKHATEAKYKVYATNANGTDQTKTDLGYLTTFDERVFRFVKTSSSILFYLNDVLVATHTTNIPSGTTEPNIEIDANNNSHPSLITQLQIGNNYIFIGSN
jgi:hypothetical protein